MTSEGISSKPILALDAQDKEQNNSAEKQPTLPLDKKPKTKDEQRDKQKGEQKPEQDFDAIYKALHAKFPNIINMDKPVLLAVGVRREILKHLEDEKDITNLILNKWIKWYFRKSKYFISYDEHTAYSIFAVLCGCISVVIPGEGVDIETWYPSEEDRYGIAYGLNDLDRAKATSGLVKKHILDEENKSSDRVLAFAAESQSFFG